MLQYVIPFFLYLGTLLLPGLIKFPAFLTYLAGIVAVSAALYFFRDEYKIRIKPTRWQFMAGAVIAAAWILLEGHYPPLLGSRELSAEGSYLIIRLFGSVVVASVVEELFTRGFLARYLLQKNWRKAPIGRFTATSFLVVAAFFSLAHSRWLPALIAGIVLNLLIIREKNIGSTIIAHGFANLLVGLYIISTGSWGMIN